MSRPDRDRDEPLSLLDPEVEEQLCEALRSAWAPTELSPEHNEQLIAAALEDPLAPPTEEELVESQRLRAALEGRADHPDARLAEALRAAAAPRDLGGAQSERIAARAIGKSRRGNVVYVTFGTAAGLAALAAGLALLLSPIAPAPTAPGAAAVRAAPPRIAVSRSTAPLFETKFMTGQATARIDRITMVRERELRDNRYALWGAR